MKCIYCETTVRDLRPYGPNGSMVCFECAFETPERKRETEMSFSQLLGAIKGPAIIDGSVSGVRPLILNENDRKKLN